MSCPAVDQASKQNFVVNIQGSEFGKLVVRWHDQDKQGVWKKQKREVSIFKRS